jgi:hypothetical protein
MCSRELRYSDCCLAHVFDSTSVGVAWFNEFVVASFAVFGSSQRIEYSSAVSRIACFPRCLVVSHVVLATNVFVLSSQDPSPIRSPSARRHRNLFACTRNRTMNHSKEAHEEHHTMPSPYTPQSQHHPYPPLNGTTSGNASGRRDRRTSWARTACYRRRAVCGRTGRELA